MFDAIHLLSPALWAGGLAIALVAGFVKGSVGFAMPMVMISGLSSIISPELALAILILPTLVTNAAQALRGGWASARRSLWEHRIYVVCILTMVALSAQIVLLLPQTVFYLALGVPITLFAAMQLGGVKIAIAPNRRVRAQLGLGCIAGFFGGISGVWGPPTVLYLTALDTPKDEQMRVQGIVYGLGAAVLTLAHIKSGIVTTATATLSAIFIVPAMLGTIAGFMVSDRLDQNRFRKLTLAVLVLAGLNLVRRGIIG